MRKLLLDPESLQVESFDTDAAVDGRGTVRGWQLADPANPIDLSRGDCCVSPLCMDTPLASCDGTCSCGTLQPAEPVAADPAAG